MNSLFIWNNHLFLLIFWPWAVTWLKNWPWSHIFNLSWKIIFIKSSLRFRWRWDCNLGLTCLIHYTSSYFHFTSSCFWACTSWSVAYLIVFLFLSFMLKSICNWLSQRTKIKSKTIICSFCLKRSFFKFYFRCLFLYSLWLRNILWKHF